MNFFKAFVSMFGRSCPKHGDIESWARSEFRNRADRDWAVKNFKVSGKNPEVQS